MIYSLRAFQRYPIWYMALAILARYFRKLFGSLCSNTFIAITLQQSIFLSYPDLLWYPIDLIFSNIFIDLGELWLKLDFMTLANLAYTRISWKNGSFVFSRVILGSFGSIPSLIKREKEKGYFWSSYHCIIIQKSLKAKEIEGDRDLHTVCLLIKCA